MTLDGAGWQIYFAVQMLRNVILFELGVYDFVDRLARNLDDRLDKLSRRVLQ